MNSTTTKSLPENPRERANFLSVICYCYTMPIFFKGFKKPLQQSDLYKELKEDKSDTLGSKLCSAWEEEVKKKAKTKKEPSLLAATLNVFGWKILLYGIALLCFEFLFKIQQPSLVGNLITKFQNKTITNFEPFLLSGIISYHYMDKKNDITETYIYAGALILTSALHVLSLQCYMMGTLHLGMKIRIAMCSMIYRKAIRMRKTALGDITVGQVVNLLSNDVGRLDTSIIFLHFIWVGPLGVIVITFLMYKTIGAAAFVGIGVMMAFIPLEIFLGKKTATFRWNTAVQSDERFRLMNEIIEGIKVIKMYAWEKSFGELIRIARQKEIDVIRHTLYIRAILLSFAVFVTRVSIFMSIATYVLLGYFLSAEKAFVITAYYNVLRRTMTTHFPQSIAHLAETLVSLKRIQNFLQYNEIEINDKNTMKNESERELSHLSTISKDLSEINSVSDENQSTSISTLTSIAGIDLSHIKAKWDTSSAEYTLEDVSLKAQSGTLVAIIGPVGSGKSSLIQVILGELPIEEGNIEINGSISYASQEPWLFAGTIRQNILFGQQFDQKRYKSVVKKCALKRDFELMPNGDRTFIGERGISLSGGQKARISLARAVYRKSAIYLLDDPLSAVDTSVGRHLFDQCIRDFLRNEVVILVTHQLQFLQQVDQIVILDHGKVSAVGTYETLHDSGLDFANLLGEPGKEEDHMKTHSVMTLRKYHSKDSSIWSVWSEEAEPLPMEVEELKKEKPIGLSLYAKYFAAGGGVHILGILIILCILAQLLASGFDTFLKYIVNKEVYRHSENIEYTTDNTDFYIFTVITISIIVITISRNILFFNVAMKASSKLHNSMFIGVTRARMYFFNTNTSGRILNRFSKDMGQVDEVLPSVMLDVIQIFLQLCGILIVVSIINPYFLIPTAAIAIVFYLLRTFYLKTSRHLKRIEAITRSPVFTHLSTSLNGLTTIRAFGAQNILIHEFDKHQDLHSSAFFMFITCARAFGFWLDCFCVMYIAMVTLSFFYFETNNSANIGLAITQAMGLTGMVQWGMRQSAELENIMTAVERVVEYETVDPEAELEATRDNKPPKDWPQNGRIKFENLSLRYAPDRNAELILKSLDFEIEPKEKIGIVGRTGAGKSSLINALYRLSYTEGSIIIDDIDINKMGLHDLRKKISIIPQEPVLFSGTMRYNLDPFDEYSDTKLWEALEEVKLKDAVTDLSLGLESKISEGGTNFSVGQRQLVCLARAILRENKILVMDEATANVDPQTDNLIQATIRNKFKDCTVLTIAHRLHTVMDSDKVLVIDAGELVEFASPYDLLTTSETKIFQRMVEKLGTKAYDEALAIAEQSRKLPPPN